MGGILIFHNLSHARLNKENDVIDDSILLFFFLFIYIIIIIILVETQCIPKVFNKEISHCRSERVKIIVPINFL